MGKENKLGQGPAYPCDHNSESTYFKKDDFGMSKRFYAACAAMQGLLANNAWDNTITSNTRTAYEISDELLKQEKDGQ